MVSSRGRIVSSLRCRRNNARKMPMISAAIRSSQTRGTRAWLIGRAARFASLADVSGADTGIARQSDDPAKTLAISKATSRLFNLSTVTSPRSRPVNRGAAVRADSIERRAATFPGSCALWSEPQGISVVGNGNIDVGNKTPTRNRPAGSTASLADRRQQNPPKTERPRICGAMAQQCGD